MATKPHTSSRRSFLAAAALAPVVIAAPVAHAAVQSPMSGPSLAWQAAMARWKAADAEAAAYHDRIYYPAFQAWRQSIADQEADLERRIEAIPHYLTKTQIGGDDGRWSLSTADRQYVNLAKQWATRTDLHREDPDFVKALAELLPEAKAREERIAAMRQSTVAPELDAGIEAENERLELIEAAAHEELTGYKASTLADLIAKVSFLKEIDGQIDHDDLLADLERIAA